MKNPSEVIPAKTQIFKEIFKQVAESLLIKLKFKKSNFRTAYSFVYRNNVYRKPLAVPSIRWNLPQFKCRVFSKVGQIGMSLPKINRLIIGGINEPYNF